MWSAGFRVFRASGLGLAVSLNLLLFVTPSQPGHGPAKCQISGASVRLRPPRTKLMSTSGSKKGVSAWRFRGLGLRV